MAKFLELKKRIDERKRELESQLRKADGYGVGTAPMDVSFAERKLKELDTLVQPGWGQMSSDTADKLEEWLLEEPDKDNN